jgi:hypothetical protein
MNAEKNDLDKLVDRLLKIGGERVVLQPDTSEFITELRSRGQRFLGYKAKRFVGTASRCHSNCAIRYLQYINRQTDYSFCQIVTGYALSADGLWRQHTWLLADTNVVESTTPRTHYFGVVLAIPEAAKFSLSQVLSLLQELNDCKY